MVNIKLGAVRRLGTDNARQNKALLNKSLVSDTFRATHCSLFFFVLKSILTLY